jgi:CBS domain-containing protein
MTTLQDILRGKGSDVFTTAPESTLHEVVDQLVARNCGSLVVCAPDDPGRMIGIITERDILRACRAGRKPLDQVKTADAMSTTVITASPSDSVEQVMGLMTENRIRHMPVLDDVGNLAGMISIGDVVKAQHDRLTMENHYLKNYIQS